MVSAFHSLGDVVEVGLLAVMEDFHVYGKFKETVDGCIHFLDLNERV